VHVLLATLAGLSFCVDMSLSRSLLLTHSLIVTLHFKITNSKLLPLAKRPRSDKKFKVKFLTNFQSMTAKHKRMGTSPKSPL
jgi:hypothetical protein